MCVQTTSSLKYSLHLPSMSSSLLSNTQCVSLPLTKTQVDVWNSPKISFWTFHHKACGLHVTGYCERKEYTTSSWTQAIRCSKTLGHLLALLFSTNRLVSVHMHWQQMKLQLPRYLCARREFRVGNSRNKEDTLSAIVFLTSLCASASHFIRQDLLDQWFSTFSVSWALLTIWLTAVDPHKTS